MENPRLDADSQSASVILVEDDPAIRRLITEILKMEGYQVIQFSNGEEGLEWIQANPLPFDLLITDIRMPGISGKEFADRISGFRPDIKILFISGFSSYASEDLNPCSNKEEFFLGKPFTRSELLSQVEKIVGRKVG
jgi:DNA-binding NtrC family response regulator